MVSPAYCIRNLVKTYNPKGRAPVQANRGIDLDIPRGLIYGVFGPNGAGKTTMIRQMTGMLRPTSGSITLFGRDVVSDPEVIAWYVGYYGQRLPYLTQCTAFEMLEMTGRLRGLEAGDAKHQARALLDQVGLSDKASRIMANCSGGELRIISVLSTLMGRLPVIVLDEPTAELDPIKRQQVWNCLFAYTRDTGGTVILVTHNVIEAERVVDRIAVIDEGQVIAEGVPSALKQTLGDDLRVEIRLKESPDSYADLPVSLVGWDELRPGLYSRTVTKAESATLIDTLSKEIGMQNMDDFRLLNPTLEDFYVKAVGKQWK